MWLEPKGFEEVHTRGNTQPHRLQDPSKWVPYGVGAIEGRARPSLPVLHTGGTETNAGIVASGPMDANGRAARDGSQSSTDGAGPDKKKTYGPGEEPRPRDGEPTGSAHGELL
jgi:hypothetical protein